MPRASAYQSAGVDVGQGDRFVDRIRPHARSTRKPWVLDSLGGFSGLARLSGFRRPVLAASTDGVGTKLKLALELNDVSTIGIDCVAMVVNDLIPCGARPLFFLDYYATGKLDLKSATDVIKGVAAGCRLAGCALIGGETAEMPGLYRGSDFDLAGFGVGAVEEEKLITGRDVRPGDLILGFPSSGFHSNGYSLIRKLCRDHRLNLDRPISSLSRRVSLGRALLAPTTIYVPIIQSLLSHRKVQIRSMAHITGGGITGNLPRAFPSKLRAVMSQALFTRHPLIQYFATLAKMNFREQIETFNCGYGFIVIVPESSAAAVIKVSKSHALPVERLGFIDRRSGRQPMVQYSLETHQH